MTAEQAFDEYHRAVYRFLYRLVGRGDLAEDLTQHCFLTNVRNAHGWDAGRGDTRTYLFASARNLAREHYRDEHSGLQVDECWALPVADRQRDQELSMTVAQTVAQLPDLQREALLLFEYEGFQLSEFSEIVGADVGVVKSRLHRARERLKRLLARYRKVGAA